MLKTHIDNKTIDISQSFSCKEELASTLAFILDRIIMDEYIKCSPREISLSSNKQNKIILEKRKDILTLMSQNDVEIEYIQSLENTDVYEKLLNKI